ncbi:UDP-4-amino-4,6-dideoxy-N-acetyl-beta-L-altrosamine N-acetyltransferase [Sulfurimonas hydrogeniphila]|uniref:UDP-4-amino-4, 6-dideoxy-N-acetyl-beta-L-altrosamine N-acetyltransferase n=1 Tax=Sulfurimonas TaxID=202746 RepID=UPI00165EC7CD|nr:UDP-4-amino-4,6-dideoxy-N-acetyl-beta-L-altrosamine N-acetyltransferase [Sulfurimonas hydrogeniphila]
MKMGSYQLISFPDLSDLEKEMVLQWRNHLDVKKWMYRNTEISLYEHLEHINLLEQKKDKYFLVKKNDIFLGVIYFTDIDYKKRECYFGLYANPFEKIAGVGQVLEQLCINYVFKNLKFKKLKLEVFKDNKKAINLYKKFNFKEVGVKIVHNKDVICMELKNENR